MKDNLIVGSKEYYGAELDRLEHSNLANESKAMIKKFLNHAKVADSLSYHRLYFHSQNLRTIGETMARSFLDPEAEDVEEAISKQKERVIREVKGRKEYVSEWTIEGYKATLKKFYNWLGKPEVVKDIKFKNKKKINYKKKPDWTVSQEEVDLLMKACDNARDKAIISLLYDSGIRLGELLTLRIKDAAFDDYGLKMTVSGKTGVRKVRVIGDSVGYVKGWLNVHPDTFNPEAWLFCGIGHDSEGNPNTGNPMFHQQVYAMLTKVRKRAIALGFPENKRINPHKFRHNRATELAPKLPASILDKEMGWNLDSNMPAVYLHLNDEQVDNAMLEANGINVEKSVKDQRKTRTCMRCKTVNPGNSEYCLQCGMPLDPNKVMKFEEKQRKIEESLKQRDDVSPELRSILNDIEGLSGPEKTAMLSAVVKSLLNNRGNTENP